MTKNVLKRLEVVEKKLAVSTQDLEKKKRPNDVETLLQMHEYQCKIERTSFTPEEIRKNNEESSKRIEEWYVAYLALSPEEQKLQLVIRDLEIAKGLEQFRAWLKSEERKQFDLEYAEHEADRFQTAK